MSDHLVNLTKKNVRDLIFECKLWGTIWDIIKGTVALDKSVC